MQTAWFLSDLHIKSNEDPKSQILVQFLESLKKKRPATHLFLLGDIFDLWIGSSEFFAEKYSNVTKALIALPKRGIQVTYIEGNHDIQVGDFWRTYGIDVTYFDVQIRLNGTKLYLCHGDFINQKEKFYHRYISWIRSKNGYRLAHLLPGPFWWYFGQYVGKKSREYSSRSYQLRRDQILDDFRSFSKAKYQNALYDILIAGHIHHLIDEQMVMGAHKFRIINLGSWFEEPHALCISSQHIYWENL